MKIIYEHNKHIIFTECDGFEWLDGFVTFYDKVSKQTVRIFYGSLDEIEAEINARNTLDFRNREIKEPSEDSIKPDSRIIVVPKENDKVADTALRDFWSSEATLIQEGLLYSLYPSVYRILTTGDDYIRSDIAEEVLRKVRNYTFDPSDFDFASLPAVLPWSVASVLKSKYKYFWELCCKGNNELIRKTYTAEEILNMLETAEGESLC